MQDLGAVGPVRFLTQPQAPASQDIRRRTNAIRLAMIRREAPIALVVSGVLLLTVSEAESFIAKAPDADSLYAAVFVAVIVSAIAAAIRWSPSAAPIAPSLFALAMTITAIWLLGFFVQVATVAHTGYLVVVIMLLGAVTLAWTPFLVASVVIIASALTLAAQHDWVSDTAWPGTMLVAFGAAIMIMSARLRSVRALAEARALAEQRAIIDPLTGALNRHGLETMLPAMLGTARRLNQRVFVTFIDIDKLKQANDSHGHDFGDEVLRAVSKSLHIVVRMGDLVVRWGGDEFLVVGLGQAPDRAEFLKRIRVQLLTSGIDLSKWDAQLSLGSADSMPQDNTIDDLVTVADQRMYESRRESREGIEEISHH